MSLPGLHNVPNKNLNKPIALNVGIPLLNRKIQINATAAIEKHAATANTYFMKDSKNSFFFIGLLSFEKSFLHVKKALRMNNYFTSSQVVVSPV